MTVPDSDIDVDAIRERLAAASPGPWRTGDRDPEYGDVMHPHELIIGHKQAMVELEPGKNGAADAAFIAAARQDVPALLAEVDRLRAELDEIGAMQVIEHEGCRLRIISSALHDRLCNRRVATPQGTEPEVLGCAGCGFCYPLATVAWTRPSSTAEEATR